jgi:hypothetical protein
MRAVPTVHFFIFQTSGYTALVVGRAQARPSFATPPIPARNVRVTRSAAPAFFA